MKIKTRKVIKMNDIGRGLNIPAYVSYYLLAKYLSDYPIVVGVIYTLMAVTFLGSLITWATTEGVDIFDTNKGE